MIDEYILIYFSIYSHVKQQVHHVNVLCISIQHQTYIIQSITLYIHNALENLHHPGQKRTGTSQKCKSQYSKELQDKQQVKHKKLSQIAYRMERCWYTTGKKKKKLH